MKTDVLFVNPGNPRAIYQGLAEDFSAIEPPTWALLLAESVRSVGYRPAILDVNAERLSVSGAVNKIQAIEARLICFVIYGQNPNSGTVNMSGAVAIANALKVDGTAMPICAVGSHVSALPLQVLETEPSFDYVLCNEGVYALRNLLSNDLSNPHALADVRGIGLRVDGRPTLTQPESIVPQNRMDLDLPGYAWDLLPYRETPLDLYRAHFWHAEYDHQKRTPFAAIYTSLGCVFKCNFCMINVLNRTDNEEIGVASNYAQMRFWSPEFVVREVEKLLDMGVRTLRISDEMFLLNKKYFVPFCEMLCDRGYGDRLNMWAYSRIDTISNPEHLQLIRNAGIRWLALGIESGDRQVRLEVTKGKFEDIDIHGVVSMIESYDIDVIANYLFGLPGDTYESMQKTLELSHSLCTVAWNGYPAMALPGSGLYKTAVENGYALPQSYEAYSFHGYDTLPLPTDALSAKEVLEFRDNAFLSYHTGTRYLNKVQQRFGAVAVNNIKDMLKIKLKRPIFE
ncbi:MAG: radical SAM protein [Chloroflexota bacterium]|nr:radical SAM protein [Chloroflexota bacterium]